MTDRPKSLFQKVWDAHHVCELASSQSQLLIGTHLIHEVTSPQAFAMLRELKLPVRFPERTFATVDHIIPTDDQSRPLADDLAEAMMTELEVNCREHEIQFFGPETGAQGIVLKRSASKSLILAKDMPPRIDATYDLSKGTFFGLIGDAAMTLAGDGARVLR